MQEVYFISGQVAAGKSRFATAFANSRGLEIFDLDDTLEEMISKNSDEYKKLGVGKFLDQVASERYANLIERAMSGFADGKSVVVVAPFTKQIAQADVWQKLVQPFIAKGAKPVLVWVNISDELRAARIKERGSLRDLDKLSDMGSYFKAVSTTAPVIAHIPIDGSLDFQAQIEDNF